MDVTDEGKQEIKSKLDELVSNNAYWTKANEKVARDSWMEILEQKCGGSRAEILVQISCSATADVHVARGLLYNGILDDLETSALNQNSETEPH